MTHKEYYDTVFGVFGNNENDHILREYLMSKRMERYMKDLEDVKKTLEFLEIKDR